MNLHAATGYRQITPVHWKALETMEQALLDIKQRLSNHRQDRTKFLAPAEVADLYSEFGDVIRGKSATELEAVQGVYHDVILMFSLAFVTVGYTHFVASTYAITLTIHSLLGYLSNDPALTPKEMDLLGEALQSVLRIATNEASIPVNPDALEVCDLPEVDLIIRSKLTESVAMFDKVKVSLSPLKEEEWPLYIQVVRLRRDILCTASDQEFSPDRMTALGVKYHKVKDLSFHSGIQDQSQPLRDQIQSCRRFYEWFKDGIDKDAWKADSELSNTYHHLRELVSTLDVFIMTRRWTLRGTDLYQQIKQLAQLTPWIAERVTDESPDTKLWFLCLYMGRRCWTLIYKLLMNSEPVSEALLSIFNQVSTMKRCLNEVSSAGGINNLRELYPYQMKLSGLDNLRVDGKFVVDGDVPPGQGILNGMLAECFDIMYELKVDLEEKIDQGEVEDEDSIIAEEDEDSSDDEDHPAVNKPMSLLSDDTPADTPSETPSLTPAVTPTEARRLNGI